MCHRNVLESNPGAGSCHRTRGVHQHMVIKQAGNMPPVVQYSTQTTASTHLSARRLVDMRLQEHVECHGTHAHTTVTIIVLLD